LQDANIRKVDPDIIFGRIYDHIGFKEINEELFRHLDISRIVFLLSNLKMSTTLPLSKGKPYLILMLFIVFRQAKQ